MHLKKYLRNDVIPTFIEFPAFRFKSSWNLPKVHPNLEVFLSEIEKELFSVIDTKLSYPSLSNEEWHAIYSLADDRSIVIKKTDKGSSVVVWDCINCIKKAEKQLYCNDV